MLNAIGLQGIGVHRFVREKLPLLRERGARTIVNICGTTLDEYAEVARVLSDARRRRRDRAEHLLPQHQGRRHPVRVQPCRHRTGHRRGSQSHDAAADSQAHAQRDRRRLVRALRRRGRRRRGVARQHVPRHGDRRRDAAAEALERARRPQRPRDSPDRRSAWSGSVSRTSAFRSSAWAASPRPPMRSSSCSPARPPCRSARRTSPIRSSGPKSSTASTTTCGATRSRASPISIGQVDTTPRREVHA